MRSDAMESTNLKKRNSQNDTQIIDKIKDADNNDTKSSTLSNKNNECIIGDSFHQAIWPVLAIAQCFGVMPVVGIGRSNPINLSFRWRTFRTLWSLMYVFGGIFVGFSFLKQLIKIGISAKNVVSVVFFSCCTFIYILFLLLAQRWRELILEWTKFEHIFINRACYQPNIRKFMLSTKIRLAATCFFLLALLEHGMFLSSNTYNYSQKVKLCNWTGSWQDFFLAEYRHVFQILPYHVLITIIVELVNIALTFTWNYMDIFIIVISIALRTRFQQLNQRLSTFRKKIITETTWYEVRLHYVQLCELLEMVDVNLAPIILLSCANNLYFICFQLLNIFNKLPYLINSIYFWYSLLYLIGRTCVVFLCAGSIHDASRQPIKYIRSVPTCEWCTELERFADQVATEQIALSGMKFFFMTRKLLFGMAGTVVTYELVLLQFDEESKHVGATDFCFREHV